MNGHKVPGVRLTKRVATSPRPARAMSDWHENRTFVERTPLSMRSPELLHARRSLFLVVDLQEKLINTIPRQNQILTTVGWLNEASRLLEIPACVTEQYPRGLGRTMPDLARTLPPPEEKLRFSAVDTVGWKPAAESADGRDQVVLIGIETHVCILQTALDLVALGYRVYLPVDACGSRYPLDHDVALQRMQLAGVTLTTAESVLFEWCETAEHPHFKTLSKLIKSRGGN